MDAEVSWKRFEKVLSDKCERFSQIRYLLLQLMYDWEFPFSSTSCPCAGNSVSDEFGIHYLHCSVGGWPIKRHDSLTLFYAFQNLDQEIRYREKNNACANKGSGAAVTSHHKNGI